MKKTFAFIAVIAILVSSTTVFAGSTEDWKSYYKSNDGNKYTIDKSSFITSGDGTEITANAMWKFANPSKYNGMSRIKMQLKANCFDKSLNSFASTAYNAKGKVINKDDGPTELEMTTNPVNAAAFKFMCAGQ